MKQCADENLKKVLKDLKIDKIVVSNLDRTLYTVTYAFNDEFEADPKSFGQKMVLIPIFSEIGNNACDIPLDMKEKIDRFDIWNNVNRDYEFEFNDKLWCEYMFDTDYKNIPDLP